MSVTRAWEIPAQTTRRVKIAAAPRHVERLPPAVALAGAAAFAAALAAATLLIPTHAVATVISIDQPAVPLPSGPNGLGNLDARIGAGVPNTGGVVPDTPAAPQAAEAPPAVTPTTNAELAANALATTNTELVAIAALGTATPVRVVLIAASDPKADLLAKAKSAQSADVDRLQKAIAANAMFKADLAAKNIDVAKIVSAEVDKSGALTVYAMA